MLTSRSTKPVSARDRARGIAVHWLGLVEYDAALDLQRRLVAARLAGEIGDTLLLLEHPHTYTLGRRADPAHVLASEAELARLGARVVPVDRGGDVTYHGPGQLVGYPILDLRAHHPDVHWYLRALEEVLIRTVADFGIAAHRCPPYTGVWVGDAKIAAIGVKLSRWITSHGFALNVAPDLSYFDHIIPCGIRDKRVTSLAALGCPATLAEARARVAAHFAAILDVGAASDGCSFTS